MHLPPDDVAAIQAAIQADLSAATDTLANTLRAMVTATCTMVEALPLVLARVAEYVISSVDDAYDGHLDGIFFGSPEKARAVRALRDQGDAEYFLRVWGEFAGYRELAEHVLGVRRPAEELAAYVAELESDQPLGERTIPEIVELAKFWAKGADLVAAHRAERWSAESSRLDAFREDELLISGMKALKGRGYAERQELARRKMEYVKRRASRMVE